MNFSKRILTLIIACFSSLSLSAFASDKFDAGNLESLSLTASTTTSLSQALPGPAEEALTENPDHALATMEITRAQQVLKVTLETLSNFSLPSDILADFVADNATEAGFIRAVEPDLFEAMRQSFVRITPALRQINDAVNTLKRETNVMREMRLAKDRLDQHLQDNSNAEQ